MKAYSSIRYFDMFNGVPKQQHRYLNIPIPFRCVYVSCILLSCTHRDSPVIYILKEYDACDLSAFCYERIPITYALTHTDLTFDLVRDATAYTLKYLV